MKPMMVRHIDDENGQRRLEILWDSAGFWHVESVSDPAEPDGWRRLSAPVHMHIESGRARDALREAAKAVPWLAGHLDDIDLDADGAE